MRAAINIRTNEEPEKFLNPKGILMGNLNCIEKLSTELLHIVLLESLCLRPLEASQQITSEARLRLCLQIDKQLL